MLPAVFFFGFSMLIPFFMGINVAFTNWDGISPEVKYVGLNNFIHIFSNDDILIPVRNTVYFALLSTIAGNILALVLALAINRPFKGRNFARMAFFLPCALSGVLSVFIWSYIYREVFHTLFGINSLLGNPSTVIPGIVIMGLWNGVGINMIIYLSALTGVPKDMYESATVDGASPFQQFKNITLPMIVPAFTVCVTLSLTYGLREFGGPYIATKGGPVRSSETVAIYIYEHLFNFKRAGYGQAVALVFMIFLLVIGRVVSNLFRSREVEL